MKKFKITTKTAIVVYVMLCVVLFSSCENGADKKVHYIKEKCIILDKGGYDERDGKYTNVGKYFLIRRISDTTEYTELTGYNWGELSDYYGSKLYFSKNIGDTLFFDYIRKDRFWKKIK
jgi:hypothetical protein